MGTRSLTYTYDGDGEKIICLYRQFDGYPEGHGLELADVLLNTSNNGIECLSASIVAKLKTGWGNVYLYPVTSGDCGQEYEYHVYEDHVEIRGYPFEDRVIFSGTHHEFKEFCQEQNRKAG